MCRNGFKNYLAEAFAVRKAFGYDAGMANLTLRRRPLALIILDGFGHSDSSEGNAIKKLP